MIHWLWLLPAAEFGAIVGGLLRGWCTRGKSADLRAASLQHEITSERRRQALESLIHAVEDCPRLTGAHNRVLDTALNEAREVLER